MRPANAAVGTLRSVAQYWQSLVLTGIFGVLGIVQVVRSGHHSPWLWLVLALVTVLAATCFALWREIASRESATTQPPSTNVYNAAVYNAPVTIHAPGGAAPNATREQIGPDAPQPSPEFVRLYDYIEHRPNEPPTIRNRRFKNVTLVGPIVLALHRTNMIRVRFGVPDANPETMVWRVSPDAAKLGAVLVDGCVFEDCATLDVAFAGTDEAMDRLIGSTGSDT